MNEAQRFIIEKVVREYIENNPRYLKDITDLDDLEAVIQTSIDLLAAKWGFLKCYGSFIDAILKNDLTGTFSSADETNLKAIYFYVILKYNVGIPRELC